MPRVPPTSPPPRIRRAVFHDKHGFDHIMGLHNDADMELPLVVEFDHRGGKVSARLLDTSPRMVRYVEVG